MPTTATLHLPEQDLRAIKRISRSTATKNIAARQFYSLDI